MNIDSDRIIHSYKKENKQVSIASQLVDGTLEENVIDKAMRKLMSNLKRHEERLINDDNSTHQ